MRFILALLVVFFTSNAFAATRLGVFVTQEELNIWRTRSTSGPYKTAGDVSVSTNSPGDYDRIVVQAITGTNPFLTAPTADRWDGANLTPASGCLTGGSGFSPDTSPGLHLKMLSAAFYILLNPAYANRQTIANNIATELLYEAGQPNLSFVNTRWCPTGGTNAVNPFFGITAWVARLAQTYDMLRAAETLGIVTPMSTANRNTIEAWFHLAGIWARDVLYVTTSTWFSDAGSVAHDALPVNFTNAGGPCGSSSALGANATIYVDGSNNPSPTVFNMHLQWNNRQGDFMWLSAVIGLVLQNVAAYTTDANDMIARAKQWDKEWIAYGTQADGTPVELYRWLSTNPDLGYSTYGSGLFQSAVNTANIIARAGDTSMMDWTTTATLAPSGGNCTVTNATTKSLHSIATTMAKYVDHTITRFIPGHAADNQYRIDTTDPIPNENRVSDVYWLPAANLYWNDAYLKTVYMRTASGAPAYPSSGFVPNGTPPSGITGWNGNDAPLPGVLFMFGQMEGIVNPYVAGSTLADITWINNRGGSGNASGTNANWTADVQLKSGINNITVTATDGTNVGTATRSIIFAPTFPGNALAGAWALNEGKGNTAADISINNNTMTFPNGATWNLNQSVTFNPVNAQYGQVADANSLDFTQSFTLSAKVTMAHIPTGWQAVIVKNYMLGLWASSNAADGNCPTDGVPAAFFQPNGPSGINYWICAPQPLQVNSATHLAVSYTNGSPGLFTLYVNGAQYQIQIPANSYIEPSTGTLQVGSDQYNEFLDGTIEKPRVYNFALPLTQGGNQTPGAQCSWGTGARPDLDPSQASIIRDMNCPIIQASPPPVNNYPASATGLKVGAGANLHFAVTP